MYISLIFPTYQRVDDLRRALNSLLTQTLLPYETIVVDQSDDAMTKDLCALDQYTTLNIRYIYSDCKSPPKAKQIGMMALGDKSETMIFFDDDVELDREYLSRVRDFLESYPKALGGGGQILNLPHKKSVVEDLGYALFRHPIISHEFCATDAQYHNAQEIQPVLTLIGCNMFFRSHLAKEFAFVDWMKRYGHADDTFFTYQISHKYPNSLFYLPAAKISHFESPAGRILKTQKFTQILCHRYVFWKTYHFSMLTFYWWSFGFLVWSLLKTDQKLPMVWLFLSTHRYLSRNSKAILVNPHIVNTFIYSAN